MKKFESEEKIHIAIVKPSIVRHMQRGTGIYAGELFDALKKYTKVKPFLVEFGDELSAYDLVHYPYFDPFFLTLPLLKKAPTVVTVHDLIPLAFPGEFPKGFRGSVKWFIQRFALSRVSCIVTDSYASKKDICRFVPINPAFVQVVYLGVGKQFKDQKKKRQPFLLYVGDVNFNKNIKRLLQAFLIVRQRFTNIQLKLVGKGFTTDSSEQKGIIELLQDFKIKPFTEVVGSVSVDKLVNLYNTAMVYVQPSLAEGFGLPVLEAFACGCPVVSSNASSLREIAADAAQMVNPDSEADIARGIVKVLENDAYKKNIVSKGTLRASQFTWEKTAKQMQDIYQKAVILS